MKQFTADNWFFIGLLVFILILVFANIYQDIHTTAAQVFRGCIDNTTASSGFIVQSVPVEYINICKEVAVATKGK